MPNRILREGILTSRRINRTKPQAELFYRRLMSVVDDFGRYSADPSLLRASCFPLRLDEVREADISRWLTEVQLAGLIALYAVNEEPYLELLDFRQTVRALRSKFPPPPGDAQPVRSTCVAGAQHMRPEAEAEAEAETETRGGGRARETTTAAAAAAAETEPLPPGARPGRTPPTLDDVLAEAKTRGFTCDAESWWKDNQAAGWVDAAGKPIRSWRPTLAAWEARYAIARPPGGNGKRPTFAHVGSRSGGEWAPSTPEEAAALEAARGAKR